MSWVQLPSAPYWPRYSLTMAWQSIHLLVILCLFKRGRERRGEMQLGAMEETILLVDDDALPASSHSCYSPFASTCLCRICHEEEDERCTTMESPCSCSGTLKFAHRECIQRWCDEKGSNVCEICLQTFEPGYSVPEKQAAAAADTAVSIRLNSGPAAAGFITASAEAAYSNFVECATASARSAYFCRSATIIITIMLLVRHFFAVAAMVEADRYYAFAIPTLFLLRVCGILLPFYLIMRLIAAIQQAQLQYQLEQLRRGVSSSIARMEEEEAVLAQHTIQIS